MLQRRTAAAAAAGARARGPRPAMLATGARRSCDGGDAELPTHDVVELPDAREACGERDLGERQVGLLDEQSGGLRAPAHRELQRPGPHLGDERAVQVPLAHVQRPREPGDAALVDHPLGDEPQRARERGRRGGPSAASPAQSRVGSACTRGTRRSPPRRARRRSARSAASASARGTPGGSRHRCSSRRTRAARRSGGRGSRAPGRPRRRRAPRVRRTPAAARGRWSWPEVCPRQRTGCWRESDPGVVAARSLVEIIQHDTPAPPR